MRRQSGIYKIQSKIKPERIYIGSAKDFANRWRHHLGYLRRKTHPNPKLQAHFNKYGETDLQFSILLGCEVDYLLANEQFFIDSYKPWFNICQVVAHSRLGIPTTPEAKLKQRLAKLGKPLSEEHKKKFKGRPAWNKGKKASPLAILHQSKAQKGKPSWNKGNKGFRAGRITSEETKKKMSIAAKGRIISKEQREKISNTLKGKPLTEETKRKISESIRRVRAMQKIKNEINKQEASLCN